MKINIPGPDVPLVIGGGLINPPWYEALFAFTKLRLADLPDVDTSSLADGDALVWDATAQKFVFVAN